MTDLTPLALALYALPLAGIVAAYLLHRRRREASHSRDLAASVDAGLTEPASLHPVVDPVRCIGSSTCVKVCPEQALGIIGGKAQLTNPAACIGHGACEESCPVDAIVETRILEYHGEKRGDLIYTKPMLLSIGDLYEEQIAKDRAEDARYR